MPITAERRTYVGAKYGLELDGVQAGWVSSVEGGNATSDVVVEALGADYVQRKHIAGVKYEDIVLSFGTGMSKGLYDWIKDSLEHKYSRKDGAVVFADYNLREQARLDFRDALITEIGFPALDAASKDAAKMTLKLSPEYTRRTAGGKGAAAGTGLKGAQNGKLQKKWLPSNFRLKIDGLDCSRVNKIGAIVVKQKVVEEAVGELRDYEREPAHLEIPNLAITMAESDAQDFYAWHEDFVVKGNNGQEMEKEGSLDFLTPNLQETLFTLRFRHLGIFRLTPEPSAPGGANVARVTAELYCEEMAFDYKAAWA